MLKHNDFSEIISAVQKVGKAAPEIKKIPIAKKIGFVESFISFLQKNKETLKSTYKQNHNCDNFENELEESEQSLKTLIQILTSKKNLPPGPTLIFASWSSPLLRFCEKVIPALAMGNSVLLHQRMNDPSYELLNSLAYSAGFPEDSLQTVCADTVDLIEIIYTHPSIRAVLIEGNLFETYQLKPFLREENKIYKTHFGSRNPVIFLHDSPLDLLKDLAYLALNFKYRGEIRFNRWFVQEKIYDNFRQLLTTYLKDLALKHPSLWSTPQAFKDLHLKQWSSLKKESPQWTQFVHEQNPADGAPAVHLDFNNCSPWQQRELNGPILTLTRFKNSTEAVKFANTTYYSDSASIFSSSTEKSQEVADQLMMPNIALNKMYKKNVMTPHISRYETGNNSHQTDFDFFSLK